MERLGESCIVCEGRVAGALVCASCRGELSVPADFIADQIRSERVGLVADAGDEPRRGYLLVDHYDQAHIGVVTRRVGTVRIGRGGDNDIIIAHESVSRFHAQLEHRRQQNRWLAQDQGSANGTSVEGERLGGAKPIASGQRLVLSDGIGFVFVALEGPDVDAVVRFERKRGLKEQSTVKVAATGADPSTLLVARASGGGGLAIVGHAQIELTELEVALLELLAERRRSEADRPDAVRGFVRSSELLACALPFDVPAPTSNNLRGLVKRVRDKFADQDVDPVIESRARLGYRLALATTSQ